MDIAFCFDNGKTFTMVCVIVQINKLIIVLAYNNILIGQLYNEFRELFSDNAVVSFVF